MKDMLLAPGFRQDDFTRVRDDAVNFLKVSLRESKKSFAPVKRRTVANAPAPWNSTLELVTANVVVPS